MPSTTDVATVLEPVVEATLISTARGTQLKVAGQAPKINYDTRKPRQLVRKLSSISRAKKIKVFGQLDMTPLRHPDLAYVTLHYPNLRCFELYTPLPSSVSGHWTEIRKWMAKNAKNPITGKLSTFWNLEYQKSHDPHFSFPLVIPTEREHELVAAWRDIVGHPESLSDREVVHFSRKRFSSPEAIATYMGMPKGHQEMTPTEWLAQGLNPPGAWRVIGMESLPVVKTTIRGADKIAAAKAHLRRVSSSPVKTFVHPKSGEVMTDFRTLWAEGSPKGNCEIRNDNNGLLIHDELDRLFGSGAEDDSK